MTLRAISQRKQIIHKREKEAGLRLFHKLSTRGQWTKVYNILKGEDVTCGHYIQDIEPGCIHHFLECHLNVYSSDILKEK